MKLLSICVIAYNEEDYLPRLLKDMDAQLYPHEQTEIVLVDSCSNDSTKQIMLDFKEANVSFYGVQVLDNPKKIQAAGWNVAIRNARGDVISRIDAHAHLTPEFSRYVMEDIDSGEDIVGGRRPALTDNSSKWARTLLAAENSLFGSSINKSRRSEEKQYVDTMFHASYRKEVFEKVGLFNEQLIRTEDNEIHYRMRTAGYKLLYDPRIVSYQFTRSSLKAMVMQKYANGYWIGKTVSICPSCLSWYHFVPALFVISIIASLGLCALGLPIFFITILALYSLFCLISTIVCLLNDRDNISLMFLPVIYYLLHFSYGYGTIKALVRR